jgi:dolichyl-phosphate-mannose--protein O-mannosyl transferase
MFLFAHLSEYDGRIDFPHHSGNYRNDGYVFLRITPAFFASLCAPLIYLSLRFDTFSYPSSFVAAMLVACDTSMLTEHRFILSDGMLHFFTCLFLAVFSYLHSRELFEWPSALVTGLFLGAACSCKNTAWGLIPYTGFVELLTVFTQFPLFKPAFFRELAIRGFPMIFGVLFVYFLSFLAHFLVLPLSGDGAGFLSPEMQHQLIEKTNSDGALWYQRLQGPGLLRRIVALAINMHHGNMGILDAHPYESRPQSWPLLTGISVLFWKAFGQAEIACRGNAIVYYLAVVGLVLCALGVRSPKWQKGLKYVVGWACCYFPFFLIPRSMFLYHYLIPLMLGCMAAGASIELYLPKYWCGFASFVMIVVGVVGFLMWSPFCYGTTPYDPRFTIWNKDWIHGVVRRSTPTNRR